MNGSEYLLWSYEQFEKMSFFPPDPLPIGFWGDEKIGTKIASIEKSQARGVQKNLSHPLISWTKGGWRYEGDSAADRVMVAHCPNRLLG